MGIISEIRDNNYLQPNRCFTLRGDVKFIEKETQYTKVNLLVFNYYANDGKNDDIIIFFKGNPKKIADKAIRAGCNLLVMGDIIIKDESIFFNGKMIEVFKSGQYLTNENAKIVDAKDVNYEGAF
jgi:hypothetical protein